MVDAQQWLDKYYPINGTCQLKDEDWYADNLGKKRNEITYLSISYQDLSGSLTLRGFTNLTTLVCHVNKLTSLNLADCESRLTVVNCFTNKLTDLTIFSKLVNCNSLVLEDNPLIGNLMALQNLSKLTSLSIENTNITDGLEYLPESLESICCIGKLAEQLKDYKIKDYRYNYQAWRKDYNNKLKPTPNPTKPINPKIMTDAKTWLDTNYPKDKRKTTTTLDISKENLEGELDLADFPNLKELIINSKTGIRNWEEFYKWLNDNIVDVNEKGDGKGNIKAAKRSEYPNLIKQHNDALGPVLGYNCIGLLMNGLEITLGKTLVNYVGHNNFKEPVLPYDDSKTFFQLASGSGNTFKCGQTFILPKHQIILDEYEKLLKDWRAAAVKGLTIKNLTLTTVGGIKDLPANWKKQITFLKDNAVNLGYVNGYEEKNEGEMRKRLLDGKELVDELRELFSPKPQTSPPTIPTTEQIRDEISNLQNNQEDPKHSNYDDIKAKLELWTTKFPSPLNSSKVQKAYKQGLKDLEWPKKFSKSQTPDTIKAKVDELVTWTNAFTEEEFVDDKTGDKLTPAQIKAQYDKNTTNLEDWTTTFSVELAKPMTVAQIKTQYDKPKSTPLTADQQKAITEYLKWTTAFPDTEFGGKTPSQIKADYNIINASLTNWTNAFPPKTFVDGKGNVYTPAQIKGFYDNSTRLANSWWNAFDWNDVEFQDPITKLALTPAKVKEKYDEHKKNSVNNAKDLQTWKAAFASYIKKVQDPQNPSATIDVPLTPAEIISSISSDNSTSTSWTTAFPKKDFQEKTPKPITPADVKKVYDDYENIKKLYIKEKIESIISRVDKLINSLTTVVSSTGEVILEITPTDFLTTGGYGEDWKTKLVKELTYETKDKASIFEAAIIQVVIKIACKKMEGHGSTEGKNRAIPDEKQSSIFIAFIKVKREMVWHLTWDNGYQKETTNPFYKESHKLDDKNTNWVKGQWQGWEARLDKVKDPKQFPSVIKNFTSDFKNETSTRFEKFQDKEDNDNKFQSYEEVDTTPPAPISNN